MIMWLGPPDQDGEKAFNFPGHVLTMTKEDVTAHPVRHCNE